MPTNFQLKRLKLKLDIVEKPENRVHKLTDSNGARVHDQVKFDPFQISERLQTSGNLIFKTLFKREKFCGRVREG